MELGGWFALIPLSLASLVTRLVRSLGTGSPGGGVRVGPRPIERSPLSHSCHSVVTGALDMVGVDVAGNDPMMAAARVATPTLEGLPCRRSLALKHAKVGVSAD